MDGLSIWALVLGVTSSMVVPVTGANVANSNGLASADDVVLTPVYEFIPGPGCGSYCGPCEVGPFPTHACAGISAAFEWHFDTCKYVGEEGTIHFESGVAPAESQFITFDVYADGVKIHSDSYDGCEGPINYAISFPVNSATTVVRVVNTRPWNVNAWVIVGVTDDCDPSTTGAYLSVSEGGKRRLDENPFPFVSTTHGDPDWVMATSTLILTDRFSIADWYDNPETPMFPGSIDYWKFDGNKQDGRAMPLSSLDSCNEINGIYIRDGFDAYFYQDGDSEEPYGLTDSCENDHKLFLEGPYYGTACENVTDPENPDPSNLARRTFMLAPGTDELGKDGLIVAPRRVVIIDIDGCRRDALYELVGQKPDDATNLSSIVLGRPDDGNGFVGRIVTDCVFVDKHDKNARGDTDFSGSFQSVGVNYALTVLPSYTFACQAALFTGGAAAQHGIAGNEWFDRFSPSFSDADDFRRGYSGGSVQSVNQITRSYEHSFAGGADEGLCELALSPISAGDFGWGGLCSTDLRVPTIYDRMSAAKGISSVIAYNMYHSATNYHADPNITWVAPDDVAMCLYKNDDTGRTYDHRMMTDALLHLGDLKNSGEPFPDVLTLYFAGHDHRMHQLGNEQEDYLIATVDPEMGRFFGALRDWVDASNLLFAISTDHGHTQLVNDEEHSIIVEDELEETLWDMTPRYDVMDNIYETDFDAYIALNGGMANVHIRRRNTTDWAQVPPTSEVLAVAEALWHHESVQGGEKIEFIMARDTSVGGFGAPYEAYDPVLKKLTDLNTYLNNHLEFKYIDLARRMEDMNDARSGDLVLIPRVMDGYYFDLPQASGHGSPYGSDSYIPMIFAGRALQRFPDEKRTVPRANQYDFASTVAGLFGVSVGASTKALVTDGAGEAGRR